MGRSETGTDATYLGFANELPEHPVTVDAFFLDKYEVTVGRFRRFVLSYDGTAPAPGSGGHPRVADSGWDSTWDDQLPPTRELLIARLQCEAGYTWTDAAGDHEAMAINCVDRWVAMAFCAWDKGRLPTEAEWEYAAVGGNQNRLFPWGRYLANCTQAHYGNCPGEMDVVGSHDGAGRWGHRDLAGNVAEWTLDWFEPLFYERPEASGRNVCSTVRNQQDMAVARSGGHGFAASALRGAYRLENRADWRAKVSGLRCARDP